MAAQSIDYGMAESTFVVTDAGGTPHDLCGIVLFGGRDILAFTSDGDPVIRVGLATARLVVTPPVGPTLTFDKRMGTALKRLGVTVPLF